MSTAPDPRTLMAKTSIRSSFRTVACTLRYTKPTTMMASYQVPHQGSTSLVRRTQCGSSDNNDDYNQGLHIFAVFLILTCGTAACSFPVVVKAWPQFNISKHALFISRHFGTGVLIALAFAHLLPTAFENLWNECLPYFWTEGYDAMPGFIAMVAALAVMLIEMGFTVYGVRHTHAAGDVESPDMASQIHSPPRGTKAFDVEEQAVNDVQEIGESSSSSTGSSNNNAPPVPTEPLPPESRAHQRLQEPKSLTHQDEQRMILQCLLLEAGILFHSVFIGLSISLSTGTTFIALMIAISFHQMFEGLALGARIAAIPILRVSSFKPWLMSFAYGLTCPLGQAIGLGLRSTYDPEGETALLVVGIANAISAGMILYAGLVQLLGEELLSPQSYQTLPLRSRAEAVIALILGCGLMAMIAIWA